MKGKSSVSVIVPVYNEEKIIAANSKKISEFLQQKCFEFEILLCNNGSTDSTLEKAEELAKKDKRFVAESVGKKGIGLAVKKGFSAASFENIVFFPIDISFNLSFITQAIELLNEKKADIVIGSKGAKGSRVKRPFARKIYSFCYGLLLNLLFGLKISDTTGTLAFKKSRTKSALLSAKSEDAFVAAEFLINAKKQGLKITEIPVTVHDLRKNDSKIVPIKDSARMLLQMLKKRFS